MNRGSDKSVHLVQRYYPWLITLALVIFPCCRPSVVFIGLPMDRYDHNRTIQIQFETYAASTYILSLENQHYTPFSTGISTKVTLKGFPPAADGIPDAVMIPLFTGLLLPLDSRPIEGQVEDRKDLLEYLAAGAIAGAGVEPSGVSGDIVRTEREFQPLIDFLKSAEALKGSRAELIKRLSEANIESRAATISDSRFSSKSFEDSFAVLYRQYWFVLFKVPGQTSYSRLVVVPDIKR
jgi:hypothetical protein